METCEIVRRIIGPVWPSEDTAENARRIENLKETMKLIDLLTEDLHKIPIQYKRTIEATGSWNGKIKTINPRNHYLAKASPLVNDYFNKTKPKDN